MELRFTKEELAFRDEVRDFCETNLPKGVRSLDFSGNDNQRAYGFGWSGFELYDGVLRLRMTLDAWYGAVAPRNFPGVFRPAGQPLGQLFLCWPGDFGLHGNRRAQQHPDSAVRQTFHQFIQFFRIR